MQRLCGSSFGQQLQQRVSVTALAVGLNHIPCFVRSGSSAEP